MTSQPALNKTSHFAPSSSNKKEMTKTLETKKRQNIISEFLKKGRAEVAKIIDKMLIKMGSVYYIYIYKYVNCILCNMTI